MQCYALGALELFDDIYDIDQVSMTIYQPRRQNVSTYEISKDDLYRWADEVLKPTAELAFAGDGNFLCGEGCGFCKAKNECRARAEANLKLAQHDFKLPPLLTDTEIEVILGNVDELVSWASDIKEYALQQALSGKEWSGFKLVEGRSNRRYSFPDGGFLSSRTGSRAAAPACVIGFCRHFSHLFSAKIERLQSAAFNYPFDFAFFTHEAPGRCPPDGLPEIFLPPIGLQSHGGSWCDKTGKETSDYRFYVFRPATEERCDAPPPPESSVLPQGTAHTKDAPQRSGHGFVSMPCRTFCCCPGCGCTCCSGCPPAFGVPHNTVHP